jgi:sec-independent protein translocase protein TatA
MTDLFISLFIQKFGPYGLVLIVVVVLLLFGGKKIPELMKGIGKGTREFKKGLSSDEDDEKDDGKKDVAKKE